MTKNTKAPIAPQEISVTALKQAAGGQCIVRNNVVVCLKL